MINLTNKEIAILVLIITLVSVGLVLTLAYSTFFYIGTSLIIAFIGSYLIKNDKN
jgi:hypothetical protein